MRYDHRLVIVIEGRVWHQLWWTVEQWRTSHHMVYVCSIILPVTTGHSHHTAFKGKLTQKIKIGTCGLDIPLIRALE